MSDSYLASSGDIVLADGGQVYVADGFGGEDDQTPAVSVFNAESGELIWQRTDLTGGSVDDVFLQAIAGSRLIVNGQYHSITAVDSENGSTLWSVSLPENYGAVRSSVRGEVLILSAEAPREGDVRPPIVYALDLEDGTVIWETSLAEGTDLQWHRPPIARGLVFVSSTLSHPGSATGNKVHAIDIATGDVRWDIDLGGGQGFSFYPALVSGDLLILYSPEGATIPVDLSTGTEAWLQPGIFPLAIGLDGSIYAGGDGVVVLSHEDGQPTPLVRPANLGLAIELGVVQDNLLVMNGRLGAIGFDLATEELAWRLGTPDVVAPPAITSDIIAMPIGDPRGIAVFEVP